MTHTQAIAWEIVPAQPGEAGTLGLRIRGPQQPDAPWPYFFTGIRAARYPAVLKAASRQIGSAGEYVGVTFPGDLDEADELERGGALPADAVAVYQSHWGETVMPRTTFYIILSAFAEWLLEQPAQPTDWYEAMRKALAKLRTSMAADATNT